MAYAMVTQLFPALLASMMRVRRVSAAGAMAGILVGELTVAVITLGDMKLPALLPSWPSAITDLNIGIVALLLNLLALGVVSLLIPASRSVRTG